MALLMLFISCSGDKLFQEENTSKTTFNDNSFDFSLYDNYKGDLLSLNSFEIDENLSRL